MRSVDYLIIGGGVAGTTAAQTLRDLDSQASITILTDEDYHLYSRILLSNYISKTVKREQVFLKKPDWYKDKKIELVKGVRAQRLEASGKRIILTNNEEYGYGKLLISIGGKVIKLKAGGADAGNIFYFYTLDDADKIAKVAQTAKKAVIIGGGLIGLDFAVVFKANNINDITFLVLEDYFWQGKLDSASSELLTNILKNNGIKIVTREEVECFEPAANLMAGLNPKMVVGAVKTKSGKRYEADIVGIGIGIKSDLAWLGGSGIELDRAILTNEYLETNLPDVYAAGDCAQFHDLFFNKDHILGTWANATAQGVAVARTMFGIRTLYETVASYTAVFFKSSCSFIGMPDEAFADEVISRGTVKNGRITRIFIKTIDNVMRIVGATIVNSSADIVPITSAIKNKVDISSNKEKLADLNFDLSKISSS